MELSELPKEVVGARIGVSGQKDGCIFTAEK